MRTVPVSTGRVDREANFGIKAVHRGIVVENMGEWTGNGIPPQASRTSRMRGSKSARSLMGARNPAKVVWSRITLDISELFSIIPTSASIFVFL